MRILDGNFIEVDVVSVAEMRIEEVSWRRLIHCQCDIEIRQQNIYTFFLIVNIGLDIRRQSELNWILILIAKLELQLVD